MSTRCLPGLNRDPMEWSQLHFELLITFQLPGVWPVAPFYGPETMTKFYSKILTFFQKRDPQTRERRVRQWLRAQNEGQTNPVGVLVQPRKGSGTDFGDMGFALLYWLSLIKKNPPLKLRWKFCHWKKILWAVSPKSVPDPFLGCFRIPNGLVWTSF